MIKQINSLEEQIKVTLFYRSHNGVTLTEAGKSFYKDDGHAIIMHKPHPRKNLLEYQVKQIHSILKEDGLL